MPYSVRPEKFSGISPNSQFGMTMRVRTPEGNDSVALTLICRPGVRRRDLSTIYPMSWRMSGLSKLYSIDSRIPLNTESLWFVVSPR